MNRVFHYFLIFTITFFITSFGHEQLLTLSDETVRFSLREVYIFNAVISFLICAILNILSKSMFSQIGFIYLGTLVLKIAVFFMLFNNTILKDQQLTKAESFNLLLPIAIFLFIEVFLLAKILNKNHTVINSKK